MKKETRRQTLLRRRAVDEMAPLTLTHGQLRDGVDAWLRGYAAALRDAKKEGRINPKTYTPTITKNGCKWSDAKKAGKKGAKK